MPVEKDIRGAVSKWPAEHVSDLEVAAIFLPLSASLELNLAE
jgi:hypothetical protein